MVWQFPFLFGNQKTAIQKGYKDYTIKNKGWKGLFSQNARKLDKLPPIPIFPLLTLSNHGFFPFSAEIEYR